MKSLFFLSIIFLIFSSFSGCDETEPIESPCGEMATVKDLTGLDGCGYVFELADATRLELMPMCGTPPLSKGLEMLSKIELRDGFKVSISYTIIPESASICMAADYIINSSCELFYDLF